MDTDWKQLRLPVMAAPMFIVSNLDLVISACRAGVIGAFPTVNSRAPDTLDNWLRQITEARAAAHAAGERFAPFCVNMTASNRLDRAIHERNLASVTRYEAPLILTNLGDPSEIVAAAHGWGGKVFHDVTTMKHAEKAISAGVDGLMLVCAGAGGHAGTLNPFAFLPQVRKLFKGPIMLAGGIADGAGIAAALTLGADIVVMGTRFIATRESGTYADHKQMLVASKSEDVLYTDAIAGMPASFLKPSMIAVGLDPDNLPPPAAHHRPNLPEGIKPWKTVWSGGHSTGLIDDVPDVSTLVSRLETEMIAALPRKDWRENLREKLA